MVIAEKSVKVYFRTYLVRPSFNICTGNTWTSMEYMASPLLTQLLVPIHTLWTIHINISMCSEVTLDIFPWKELQWAIVSICTRLVQMEPIQRLFCAKAQRPLATVAMSTGGGTETPAYGSPYQRTSKGTIVKVPKLFSFEQPSHRVPASIGLHMYLWYKAWCRSSLLTRWALSHVSVFFC